MRRRWVGTLMAAAFLSAAMAVAGPGRPAHAASPVLLGLHNFGRMVVDPATSQLFVSGPGDGSIVVLDLAGNIKKTITGEPTVESMVVVGGVLYVALINSGTIDRIDTGTLTETSPLVTGLTQPRNLAYAGGKLWTTTGACSGGAMKPVSVDLTAQTPTANVYDNVFTGANGLSYCARYATNHASNPSFILASGTIPGTFDYMDVSGSSPVISKSVAGGAESMVVMADQAHFLTDSSAGCPTQNTYCFTEFRLSDFAADGNVYPAARFPDAVDVTSANGPKMVGGVNGLVGQSNVDVLAYPIGDPTQTLANVSYGDAGTPYYGVALSPDGLTAYAIEEGSSCPTIACEELDVIPLPALQASGAPSEPTAVTAKAGVGAASINWGAPIYHGKSAITGYTVTASSGETKSVDSATFGVVIAGLDPVAHTFTVTATNSNGTGPPSAPSNSVTPQEGGTLNVLTPARILDTRSGNGGFPVRRVPANSALSLQVTGRGGVPAAGVGAVVMNVTVTNTTGPGFLAAYPTGSTRPNASNINFTRSVTVPNLIELAVGPAGKVDLYVGGAAADVVVDVEGWVGDSTDSYFAQGLFSPSAPVRLYDSRYISTANGNVHHPLGPGQSLTQQIWGYNGIPYGTSAVVLNVTVTGPTTAGYLTVYPSGAPRPMASNLNFAAGQTVPNRVIVGVGPDGSVTIFNGLGTVDVVIDMNGWFTGPGMSSQPGSAFITGIPSRIYDSRTCACKIPPGYFTDFPLTGSQATALSLNVTATNETAYGYLTVYPDDGSQGQNQEPPLASDLNFRPGQTVANMTVVMLPSDTAFNVFNGAGYTDVILDLDGFYGPAIAGLVAGT